MSSESIESVKSSKSMQEIETEEVTTQQIFTEARKVMPESAKGFHEGGEALPEGLKQMIGDDERLKLIGDVVAFSTWDDEYMHKFMEYKLGHANFQACFVPCGCPPPFTICCWTVCLPCTLYGRFCKDRKGEAEKSAVIEGAGYHLIFPRHYVWLSYIAETDILKTPIMTVIKISPIGQVLDAKAIDNVDEHMRDGICGCIQDSTIPDMPGVLIRGPSIGEDAFYTWTTYRDIHGNIHGDFKETEAKYFRRTVCDGRAFAEQLMTQKVWCETNAPPAQQSMEGPGAAEAESPQQLDLAGRLRELKALLDEGILTEEEFAAEKAKVLGNPPTQTA